jgi:5-methylcytosine-specific restriction endonuclease McrA
MFNPNQYVKNTKTHHRNNGFKIDIHRNVIISEINNVLENGCPYCGKQVHPTSGNPNDLDSLALDIKNPFQRKLTPWNFQIICRECNSKKGHLTHNQFKRLLELTGNNPPANWNDGLSLLLESEVNSK